MSIPQNITNEHVSLAMKEIDNQGIPDYRDSTKFYLFHEGNFYPPKYVISVANKYANGQELSSLAFSGGVETNSFLTKLGFKIVEREEFELIESHSWTILSSTTAIKALDKSAFVYCETGVPVEIRGFFDIDGMSVGQRKEIKLFVGTKEYQAHLSMSKNKRTKLSWYSDFLQILSKKFGTFKDGSIEMKFQRAVEDAAVYHISWSQTVDEGTVKLDIDADKIENEVLHDLTAKKEGALKQYYGKRYERDPKNRKRAIELHGLACVVCGFDFEKVYGDRGKDFIEVHHTKPLSLLGGEETFVDPLTDLVPVCSNCHRMIHRRQDDVLSIEQLKDILQTVKI